ncbi:Tyrosine kinase, putative [Hondaea fermentalgiana]|uniref:Tyrosine kinase, putative n=1 Tax=Hondaea fermentalgiana TaxID=2315210 RepID=A0A2R5H302_9STRA|nr:Tyrosine kinase, putative [Hondaea fermentalgiana]|eukprot:GBG34784.1 Tyrosine kinase, putative [Hondaea fermentalgiana]
MAGASRLHAGGHLNIFASAAPSPSSRATSATASAGSVSTTGSTNQNDEEMKKFLESVSVLRNSRSLEDRMLLFEGDYKHEPVFVRDIALRGLDTFDGDAQSLQLTLNCVERLAHPCLTRVIAGRVIPHQGRLVVLSQRAVESVADKIYKSRSLYYEETLTKEDAINISLAVCEAGEFLHEQGIWQLNLKPSSVLVFPDSETPFKLSESCLHPMLRGASLARRGPNHGAHGCTVPPVARSYGATAVSPLHDPENYPQRAYGATINHTFPMGFSLAESFGSENPEYLAIEQLAGEEYITPKADVFSFGMLLWQLLHLRNPYPPGMGPVLILKALQQGNRPHLDMSLVGIDSPLRRIIELCWTSDPALRPSFSDVRRMLLVARQMHAQERLPVGAYDASSVMRPIQLRETAVRGSQGSFTVELDDYEHDLRSSRDDEPSHGRPISTSSSASLLSLTARPHLCSGGSVSDPALDDLSETSASVRTRPPEIETNFHRSDTFSSEGGSTAAAATPDNADVKASRGRNVDTNFEHNTHKAMLSPACSESTETETEESPLSPQHHDAPSSPVFAVGETATVWHAPTRQFINSTVRRLDAERRMVGVANPVRHANHASRLVSRSSSSTRSRGSDDTPSRCETPGFEEEDVFWVHEHNLIAYS